MRHGRVGVGTCGAVPVPARDCNGATGAVGARIGGDMPGGAWAIEGAAGGVGRIPPRLAAGSPIKVRPTDGAAAGRGGATVGAGPPSGRTGAVPGRIGGIVPGRIPGISDGRIPGAGPLGAAAGIAGLVMRGMPTGAGGGGVRTRGRGWGSGGAASRPLSMLISPYSSSSIATAGIEAALVRAGGGAGTGALGATESPRATASRRRSRRAAVSQGLRRCPVTPACWPRASS